MLLQILQVFVLALLELLARLQHVRQPLPELLAVPADFLAELLVAIVDLGPSSFDAYLSVMSISSSFWIWLRNSRKDLSCSPSRCFILASTFSRFVLSSSRYAPSSLAACS